MNNPFNVGVFLENGMGLIKTAQVNFIILYFFAGDLFYPFQ
jgi:hypothetical protein